jgi:hypothetical protein
MQLETGPLYGRGAIQSPMHPLTPYQKSQNPIFPSILCRGTCRSILLVIVHSNYFDINLKMRGLGLSDQVLAVSNRTYQFHFSCPIASDVGNRSAAEVTLDSTVKAVVPISRPAMAFPLILERITIIAAMHIAAIAKVTISYNHLLTTLSEALSSASFFSSFCVTSRDEFSLDNSRETGGYDEFSSSSSLWRRSSCVVLWVRVGRRSDTVIAGGR